MPFRTPNYMYSMRSHRHVVISPRGHFATWSFRPGHFAPVTSPRTLRPNQKSVRPIIDVTSLHTKGTTIYARCLMNCPQNLFHSHFQTYSQSGHSAKNSARKTKNTATRGSSFAPPTALFYFFARCFSR